jgi:DNA mismatch repair protein MutS
MDGSSLDSPSGTISASTPHSPPASRAVAGPSGGCPSDTPMMTQWKQCKASAGDAIVLFRLGDFYEAFAEDAVTLARELEIALTARQSIPMAGIPWMALDGAMDKLVARGYRIAIAEQIEETRGKGLMRREIVRMVSAGTMLQGALLPDKQSNFLVAIYPGVTQWGLAVAELSTGELRCCELTGEEELWNELGRLRPSEVLAPERWLSRHPGWQESLRQVCSATLSGQPDGWFDEQEAADLLQRRFGVAHWKGLGLEGSALACGAITALARTIEQLFPAAATTLAQPRFDRREPFLAMDRQSTSHLGLFHDPSRPDSPTLLQVLDQTATPMGARLLAEWLRRPLAQRKPLEARWDAQADLVRHPLVSGALSEHLKGIRDLERVATRLAAGLGGPRDLLVLRNGLRQLPLLRSCTGSLTGEIWKHCTAHLQVPQNLIELLEKAVADEPPLRCGEGGCWKIGFDAEYDRLVQLTLDRDGWLQSYQERMRAETGCRTLKVGHHQTFGYFLEVSRGQAQAMPAGFERRQTLANAERFVTEELRSFERDVVIAQDQLRKRELAIFQQMRECIQQHLAAIRQAAHAIAKCDVLTSLIRVAQRSGWTRPDVVEDDVLEIIGGRHPVVESTLPLGSFVANDCQLTLSRRLMILTGPNMGGKSTYMRMVGLLVILAQMGAYVPAKRMRFGLVDQVFTRIGAADDVARGQSTFMVEMLETSAILRQATQRSLVLLDEIGRGTSTSDGLAIAWAVAEDLIEGAGKGAKTLFATHYLELTQLSQTQPRAFNAHVAVQECDGHVSFLHKIKPGPADRSYGLHVARLAGLPSRVIQRALELQQHLDRQMQKRLMTPGKAKEPTGVNQPGLFEVMV